MWYRRVRENNTGAGVSLCEDASEDGDGDV
jgi:hypothetical protein